MIKANIYDGHGSGDQLKISENGVANVIAHQHPPLDETVLVIPTVEDFANTAGATDMRVVGSVSAPLAFSIDARNDFDLYIKTVMVTIADQNATLSQFGTIGALANGVNFFWESQGLGRSSIKSNMISNWDFVKLSRGNPAFGSTTTAFRASNVSGSSEGYLPVIDMFQVFGLQYGIRLRKGTKDKLVFEVRDDLTGVDEFTAEASITLY